MFVNPISTEYVYQISDEQQRKILQDHFSLFYNILAENKLIPEAVFKSKNETQFCISGLPAPYFNAVIGCPKSENWDAFINEQIHNFKETKMPFVWYVNEESSSEFKEKLLSHGFQNAGVFRGVIGILDKPIPHPQIPNNCILELVEDESSMDEFNDLLCATFGFDHIKDLLKTVLWNAKKNPDHPMLHWVARKNGKVVSTLSTLIQGNTVSFWNGASLPEVRRQGLSTSLRYLALQEAKKRGCNIGMSYLMAEGLAFGICSKLGYQTKWRFDVFLCPDIAESTH